MGRPGTGLGAFGTECALSPRRGGGLGRACRHNERALAAWGAPGRGLERFVLGMVLSAPVSGAAWLEHLVLGRGTPPSPGQYHPCVSAALRLCAEWIRLWQEAAL